MNKAVRTGIFFAILAAVLYALNAPFSKIMLGYLPPTLMAGFLYLGAGAGMALAGAVRYVCGGGRAELKLTRAEFPYTAAMVLLDIAAPVCLMIGLTVTAAESASLLNNFEIVATAVVALCVFKEKISARLWAGIGFVTVSCFLLSFEDIASFRFSAGSLFILLACLCWGFENNCTRKISSKDPLQIVVIKGLCSGAGSLAIGFCVGERVTAVWSVFAAMGIGLVAYGLSIFFYVRAQRYLGAARTSAYYAVAPFIGVVLSFAVFRQMPDLLFFAALAVMAVGAWLCAQDTPLFRRKRQKAEKIQDASQESPPVSEEVPPDAKKS